MSLISALTRRPRLLDGLFAAAIGALLDTFVVRTLLVPALVFDVGPRAWWPTSRYP